jgi:hypothetical protein
MNESEHEIQNQIILECSQGNSRLFRNNVGATKTQDGRFIRYGLHTGSSDLIGWRTLEITAEMVGTKIAQFVSVEVKNKNGRPSKDQINWINTVNNQGGLALVARSKEEAKNAIR